MRKGIKNLLELRHDLVKVKQGKVKRHSPRDNVSHDDVTARKFRDRSSDTVDQELYPGEVLRMSQCHQTAENV